MHIALRVLQFCSHAARIAFSVIIVIGPPICLIIVASTSHAI